MVLVPGNKAKDQMRLVNLRSTDIANKPLVITNGFSIEALFFPFIVHKDCK